MVDGLGGCTLQIGAMGDPSRRLSGCMFICGGPGDKLGVSHDVAAGGVEPWSDAEGIGWWTSGIIAVYAHRKRWLWRVTLPEWNMQMQYGLFGRTLTMRPVLSHFLSFL